MEEKQKKLPHCRRGNEINEVPINWHRLISVPPLGGTSCGGSGGMGGVHRFIFTSKLEGRRP